MGTISRTYSATDIATGEIIRPEHLNTDFNTVFNEINGQLDEDNLANNAVTSGKIATGAVTTAKINMDANLDMNSKRIIELAEPSATTDATTKSYVDTFATSIGLRMAGGFNRQGSTDTYRPYYYNEGWSQLTASGVKPGGITPIDFKVDHICGAKSSLVILGTELKDTVNLSSGNWNNFIFFPFDATDRDYDFRAHSTSYATTHGFNQVMLYGSDADTSGSKNTIGYCMVPTSSLGLFSMQSYSVNHKIDIWVCAYINII